MMTTTETTSLILTLLAHDDAQTARELATALGATAGALSPVLRQLVASEVAVTSGRGSATRYLLAADPVDEQPVALVVTAAVTAQRAERSSTASLVLADESPATQCRPRAARPVIPATTDLLGDLERTAAALIGGASLPELSARPAAPRIVIAEIAAEVGTLSPAPQPQPAQETGSVLHRECVTPVEDVAARQLELYETEHRGEAHDRATARREGRQQLAWSMVSVLMILAPVAWVVAHFAR